MRWFGLIVWLIFMVSGAPAWAMTSPELRPLEQQLATMLAGRTGEYGVAAIDLRNGATVSINGDRAFPMASTVKVAVAASYLAQVDHGRRSLDDRLGASTARRQMELMLTKSDNRATDVLIKDLGGPAAVQAWLSFHGMDGIRVDRTIAQLLGDRRNLLDQRDSATPMAMVRLLRTLDLGQVLTPASRGTLLDMMNGHLGMEMIRGRSGGLVLSHIPYPGNPQVITAMLSGQVQAALLPPGLAMQQVRAGKMKALGVTSEQRSLLAPEVPSLREIGIVGVDMELFTAVAGPATTPSAIQDKLGSAVIDAVKAPETRQRLINAGWQPAASTADGLRSRMLSETRRLGGIIIMRKITSDA